MKKIKLKNYKYILTKPKIAPKAFIASGVKLIGAVSVGNYSSVWYNTVIRADINKIEIGAHTNIQDGCLLHVSDDEGVKVGDHVTIAHGAIIHACSIQNGALIGLGAKLLNGVRVGKESVVAAGTLVPPNFVVPPRTLVKGHPAKIARKLSKREIEENLRWAVKYEKLVQKYKKEYAKI